MSRSDRDREFGPVSNAADSMMQGKGAQKIANAAHSFQEGPIAQKAYDMASTTRDKLDRFADRHDSTLAAKAAEVADSFATGKVAQTVHDTAKSIAVGDTRKKAQDTWEDVRDKSFKAEEKVGLAKDHGKFDRPHFKGEDNFEDWDNNRSWETSSDSRLRNMEAPSLSLSSTATAIATGHASDFATTNDADFSEQTRLSITEPTRQKDGVMDKAMGWMEKEADKAKVGVEKAGFWLHNEGGKLKDSLKGEKPLGDKLALSTTATSIATGHASDFPTATDPDHSESIRLAVNEPKVKVDGTVVDKTKLKLSQWEDKSKSKLADWEDKTKSKLNQFEDMTTSRLETVGDKAKDLGDKAKDLLHKAEDKLHDGKEMLKEKLSMGGDKTTSSWSSKDESKLDVAGKGPKSSEDLGPVSSAAESFAHGGAAKGISNTAEKFRADGEIGEKAHGIAATVRDWFGAKAEKHDSKIAEKGAEAADSFATGKIAQGIHSAATSIAWGNTAQKATEKAEDVRDKAQDKEAKMGLAKDDKSEWKNNAGWWSSGKENKAEWKSDKAALSGQGAGKTDLADKSIHDLAQKDIHAQRNELDTNQVSHEVAHMHLREGQHESSGLLDTYMKRAKETLYTMVGKYPYHLDEVEAMNKARNTDPLAMSKAKVGPAANEAVPIADASGVVDTRPKQLPGAPDSREKEPTVADSRAFANSLGQNKFSETLRNGGRTIDSNRVAHDRSAFDLHSTNSDSWSNRDKSADWSDDSSSAFRSNVVMQGIASGHAADWDSDTSGADPAEMMPITHSSAMGHWEHTAAKGERRGSGGFFDSVKNWLSPGAHHRTVQGAKSDKQQWATGEGQANRDKEPTYFDE